MLARAQADATHHVEKDWLSKLGGLVASSPDTSATLFGPVHLGMTGSGIETAKAPQPGAPPNASIVATPVTDKSLEPSKPAEPATNANPAASNSTASTPNNDSDKAKETTTDKGQSDSTQPAQPVPKKSRFHALKKIVKPF
jgi:hypothetical protein